MPRLGILSDLYLETVPYPDGFAPTPPDFDILVSAGDVWRADLTRGFRVLRRLAVEKPMVCVLGNHKHWNSVLNERLSCLAGTLRPSRRQIRSTRLSLTIQPASRSRAAILRLSAIASNRLSAKG